MRDRAKQKEQVQQVVMEGKVSFAKKKEELKDKKKDVAFLLLGDDDNGDADMMPTPSAVTTTSNTGTSTPSDGMSKTLEAMYHEGEGEFSGNITPAP